MYDPEIPAGYQDADIEQRRFEEQAAEVSTEVNRAKMLLDRIAKPEIVEEARRMIRAGEAEWRRDPLHVGVVGLLEVGSNTAHIIVYLDDEDFEVSDALDMRLRS